MSSLSWAISTATVQLEDAISQTEEIETLLRRAWLKVFDEPTIASLQHQISALSTAMDGAYYRVHTDVPHPNVNNAQATQNLDLPSQSIQAITYSLEYWKRAVKKICGEDNHLQNANQPDVTPSLTNNTPQAVQNPPQSDAQNQGIPSTIDTPTAAGTAQSSLPSSQSGVQAQSSTSMNVVPQTQPPATTSQTKAQNNGLPGTQQGGTTQSSAIPKMSSQTSSQLRQALIKQTQVWQPLVLHQQSLQDFTMSYVTQRIWNDFMQEFEQATSKGVFNTVEKNFRRYLIPIIAGIAVLILILGFSVFLLLHHQDAWFLFTGDAKKSYEDALLPAIQGKTNRIQVLKITHHGSSSGTSPNLVSRLRPSLAVSSSVQSDPKHRLEDDVRARLLTCKVYATDEDWEEKGRPKPPRRGDVTIRTGGEARPIGGVKGILFEIKTGW